MLEHLPTAFIFLAGAALIPFLPREGGVRGIVLLAVPVLALAHALSLGLGAFAAYDFFGFHLEAMRLDRLSRAFVIVFCLAAFLGNLYAWHVKDTVQQVASLLYSGSAIGAALAGDLVTLFFWWEGTAIASVFLIWARRTEGAYWTGLRYLVIQVGSGVILLAGLILFWRDTGSLAFDRMDLGSLATWCLFIAFGIKCAFPFLHNWLQDAYPAATVTGSVILSAFTTKLAVYALARGFAGTEILIYIGTAMTLFPLFFAEMENDQRRVLSYSLNNQLGFMVVGIGVGSQMALDGAVAHAFAHILYKALLFMSVGAVLYRTGTSKASELGGLYRTMPLTAVFCMVGAASISAFPFLSGFVAKALTFDGVAEKHYVLVWILLMAASAGVLSDTGIKVPFFTFFAHDSGKRPKEAPRHMLWAMGLTSALCILIGFFPQPFYAILPYPVDYTPYTADHVVFQFQFLLFGLLAFLFLYRKRIYPAEIRAIYLDTDWSYRRALPAVAGYIVTVTGKGWRGVEGWVTGMLGSLFERLHDSGGPDGLRSSQWAVGAMVQNIAILLAVALVVIFATSWTG